MTTETAPTKITKKIHAIIANGGYLTSANGSCMLQTRGNRFEMRSSDGREHTLDIASTDAARLNAHWQGFAA